MDWLIYISPLVAFCIAIVSLLFETSLDRKGSARKRLTRPGMVFLFLLLISLLLGFTLSWQSQRSAHADRLELEKVNAQRNALIEEQNEELAGFRDELNAARKQLATFEIEIEEQNEELAGLKEELNAARKQLATFEIEADRHWQARQDIQWVLDHPDAQRRLLNAIRQGKTLFEAIHIAQESHRKPDVRRRLDEYGPHRAEPYARELARLRVSAGNSLLQAVVDSRGMYQ